MGFEPILIIYKTFWMVVPGCPLLAQGPEECHGSARCEVQLQQNIGGFGCRTHAAHGKFILKPPLNDKKKWWETQRCFKKGSNITQKGFFQTNSLDTYLIQLSNYLIIVWLQHGVDNNICTLWQYFVQGCQHGPLVSIVSSIAILGSQVTGSFLGFTLPIFITLYRCLLAFTASHILDVAQMAPESCNLKAAPFAPLDICFVHESMSSMLPQYLGENDREFWC